MTDQQSWTEQWFKAQQQFVDTWSEMAKQGNEAAKTNQADLWAESFKIWNQGMQQGSQTDFGGLMGKSMEISKSIFGMAEQLGQFMAAEKDPMTAIQKWIESVISMLQNNPMNAAAMNPEAFGGLLNHWMAPAGLWQQMADNMTSAASPWQMPAMSGVAFNMGEAIDPLGKALQTPGIGFFREPQEKQQLGIQLTMEYHKSNLAFNQAFITVAIESLNDLKNQLTTLKPEEFPASLRALYDMWVEISEKHYAEFAMSEKYPVLYGDMVNKLMAVKKHYQELVNDLFEAMNLPTHSEVDTMQRRLQEARRENGRLRHDLNELKKTVDALSQQGAAAKPAAKEAVAEPKPTVAKKAPAKKAAVKKAAKPAAAKKAAPKKKATVAKKAAAKKSASS